MIFTFGPYTVDIDTQKTQQIYQKLPPITERCHCDGCLNFEKAVDTLPTSVHAFFDTLGVDLKRITECYVYCKNADNSLRYGGFCHVCGTLVKVNHALATETAAHPTYHLQNDFHVSFHKDCIMVEAPFENPILQIELEATIMWVLDKENTY